MPRDLFISYSSHDASLATTICSALEAADVGCWIGYRDLPERAGQPYSGEIVAAIDESRALLLLLTPDANQSEHVLNEVELARSRRLPILPVLCDGTLPSRNLEYYIRSLQWFAIAGVPDESRLADLVSAARGLLAAAEPAARRGSEAPATRSHLPILPNALIGRDAELDRAAELLRDHRLLTIHAAGGVGKTAFAIELATRTASRFTDGAWFVDLSNVVGDGVASAVAETIGVRARPDQSALDALVGALRDVNMLVVLDNCEQVVGAVAELVAAATGASGPVRFIATSREVLSISVERRFPLDPLRVPDDGVPIEEARTYSAIQLFLERAERVRPNVSHGPGALREVVRICRRLDGIPLAIELTAARTALFDVAKLAHGVDDLLRVKSRRRDGSERQRTVEALVAWSYNLLGPLERRVFVRLAVFAGPWSLDAAVHVVSDETLDALDVEDAVTSLLEKSLVQRGSDDRFRLFEVVRAYAESLGGESVAERLEAAGRHVAYFADRGMACCRRFDATGDSREFDAIKAELGDIREALARALADAGESENAARLAVALGRFGIDRGLISEVYRVAREVAALPIRSEQTRDEVAMLVANCAAVCGDQSEARRWYERIGEGAVPAMRGFALQALSQIERKRGHLEAAADYARAAITVTERLPNRRSYVIALAELASIEMNLENRAGARAALVRARDVAHDMGDAPLAASCSGMIAMVAYADGDLESAAVLLDEAVAATARSGLRVQESEFRTVRAEVSLFRSDLTAARRDALLALDAAVESGYVELAARNAETLAALAGSGGNPAAARKMFVWAAATRDRLGVVLDADEIDALARKEALVGLSAADEPARNSPMELGAFLEYAKAEFDAA